jgi:hypothetical protein
MGRLIVEVAQAKPPPGRPPPAKTAVIDVPPTLPNLKFVERAGDDFKFSQEAPYHKHVPQVYPDALGFDWHEVDYQITP